MAAPWPDANVVADLLRRLRDGDPTAPAEFAAAVLDRLVTDLRAARPSADDHARVTAAEDAVLSVIRRPAAFDPTRGDFPTYLRMAARRDLANILDGERRHHRRREGPDSVELAADGRNCSGEGGEPDGLPSFDAPELAAVIATFTNEERRALDLMRSGERRTEAFAAALGISDRPPGEQRRVVKRVKDRIRARLRRAAGES
jgi:DNA-directed RNA polymerase specialized sigma24 family protein